MAKMSTGKIAGIVIGSLLVLFLFCGGCFILGLLSSSFSSGYSGGANIYQIRIDGVISATSQASLLSGQTTTPEQIISQLEAAERDRAIRAILLRINSPGGSPAASQEIYEEIKRASKPVVVSVADTCASGAYYIACAADHIVANRSSSVGSIGVILQVANLEGLYDKLGVEYTTIKQGKYKDIGSSSRDMTAEEKQLLEQQTKQIYNQFIQDVAESRGMETEEVRQLATGWTYIGTEALDLGLIDQLGNYKDAIDTAASLGGIEGEPVITGRQQFSLWDMVLGYYVSGLYERIYGSNVLEGYVYR
ncbi:MAG: signal peptide peptidase SppA [Actinomycetia bacterium]|nr:signal peptide peptidase SppA [Actinomycetes bacterium]